MTRDCVSESRLLVSSWLLSTGSQRYPQRWTNFGALPTTGDNFVEGLLGGRLSTVVSHRPALLVPSLRPAKKTPRDRSDARLAKRLLTGRGQPVCNPVDNPNSCAVNISVDEGLFFSGDGLWISGGHRWKTLDNPVGGPPSVHRSPTDFPNSSTFH